MVRDIMSRGVITMPMTASAKDVAKTLAEEHIHGVIVTAPDGEIMGVVSELDILKVFDKDLEEITAEDIMTSPVKTVKPMDNLRDAAELMREGEIHRVVVASESSCGMHRVPVGILSASDLTRRIAGIQ